MTVAFSTGVVPVTNATLTAVKGGGTSEDYDTAAGTDTTRWSGSEPVWVGEELHTDSDGRVINETARTYLAMSQSLATGVQRRDVVTYTKDAVSIARTVDDIRQHDLVGVTRLDFINA